MSSSYESWLISLFAFVVVLNTFAGRWSFNTRFRVFNTPDSKEKKYYRFLFEKYYKDRGEIIPYFWMPKYVEATDPSARTLKI